MGSTLHLVLARLWRRLRRYDQAQACYIRALNSQPQGIGLIRIYVGLAETEFQRGHFLNCRHYAQHCLEQIAAGEIAEDTPGLEQLLDRAVWHYEHSNEEALKLRRRDLPGS